VFKVPFKDKATGQTRQTANWYAEFRDHLERVQRAGGQVEPGPQ